MDYIAFSDESYTTDRFRSIACFSFLSTKLQSINNKLTKLLYESEVKEFKWKKLKNAKYRLCSIKLVRALWEFIEIADARLDVVIWDTQDKRHCVYNRDDIENQGRMFYHLHTQALKRRPLGSVWHLYPDEKVEINWANVSTCLSAKGGQLKNIEFPLLNSFVADPYFKINELKQVRSHEEPCCQLADLFAGISVFSRTHYNQYATWLEQQSLLLPFVDDPKIEMTNSEGNRYLVLSMFNNGCKERKLRV